MILGVLVDVTSNVMIRRRICAGRNIIKSSNTEPTINAGPNALMGFGEIGVCFKFFFSDSFPTERFQSVEDSPYNQPGNCEMNIA